MPQGSVHWQGTQRRACGPGAHWNVQVVRGKVTTRCLWHACKALGIGLLLMLLGACMATIGFIVVAACVMTFEARDSAAKVVPARFRFNQGSTLRNSKNQRSRRSTSCQTTKWDQQVGLFKVNRSPSPNAHEASRKQLTAEFMQFSKELQQKSIACSIKKSPSAPTLIEKKSPCKKAPKYAGCALLNPELLQRHAVSVDNPRYNPTQTSRESLERQKMGGSQVSMAMDLHLPNKGPITLKIKDRSDTARRHQLSRQTKVEDVEEIDEARRFTVSHVYSPKLPGSYCRYPDDFVPRKRNSIDLRLLEELGAIPKDSVKTSPRDFRKVSSPNFRKMSFDRIGPERRVEKTMGNRKASLEFRKSPDFRRGEYRKLSTERFSMDYGKCTSDEIEMRCRTSSGENLRRQRYPKLHHSRSDDNRRRSFDRHRRDSQSSRYSLNTQAVMEYQGADYEQRYFITTTTSLDTEESRAENSDDSRVIDIDEQMAVALSSEAPAEADALLEEPELENLTEIDVESSGDDLDEKEENVTSDTLKDLTDSKDTLKNSESGPESEALKSSGIKDDIVLDIDENQV
ncbi:uncharacterized protein [Prorops nasuta]|uniref:uncharacterized protein isoform X3 n=1 Tax=Prorops nasuta TaxID=863751 RepID=UPI0034CEAB63